MDLNFTNYFLKQWKKLSDKDKKQIITKLDIIKVNPFRYPKHKGSKHVFKVKISIQSSYSRLMYAVYIPDTKSITVFGIFDRKSNYREFDRIFKKISTLISSALFACFPVLKRLAVQFLAAFSRVFTVQARHAKIFFWKTNCIH